MPTTPIEGIVSVCAKAIASGLVRTVRAATGSKLIHGMLRLESHGGDDYYWIVLDGSRVLRGKFLSEADELQPKFIDAMERAGR